MLHYANDDKENKKLLFPRQARSERGLMSPTFGFASREKESPSTWGPERLEAMISESLKDGLESKESMKQWSVGESEAERRTVNSRRRSLPGPFVTRRPSRSLFGVECDWQHEM